MIRILLADDHKVLLDGFVSILDKDENIEVVATAQNGKEVLQLLGEQEVDIVLLDINMPELNGVETCKKIAKDFPDVKVIALSMYKQQSYVNRMKVNGAKGYLLKDDSAEEIVKAIHTVHEGKDYYSSQVMAILNSQNLSRQDLIVESITRREKEVLELISQGMSSRLISEKLFVSYYTIETHRKSLLLKFDAKNTAELVKVALEIGVL